VGVGLFTLLWFASGIVMELPRNVLGGGGIRPAGSINAPDFKQIAISVPQAIAATEAAAGGGVLTTGVDLRAIEGRLFYEISTARSGTHLIDAVNGARLEITEEYAKQMAERVLGGQGPLQGVETLRKYGFEYTYGPLPVFRFAFADPAGTIVYISSRSGEMRVSNRNVRIRTFIAGTHTFDFLTPMIANRGTRIVLILFSFVGCVMSFFGFWILWIQFQNWRARRAGRPEAV
jgi:hypothetical protein